MLLILITRNTRGYIRKLEQWENHVTAKIRNSNQNLYLCWHNMSHTMSVKKQPQPVARGLSSRCTHGDTPRGRAVGRPVGRWPRRRQCLRVSWQAAALNMWFWNLDLETEKINRWNPGKRRNPKKMDQKFGQFSEFALSLSIYRLCFTWCVFWQKGRVPSEFPGRSGRRVGPLFDVLRGPHLGGRRIAWPLRRGSGRVGARRSSRGSRWLVWGSEDESLWWGY